MRDECVTFLCFMMLMLTACAAATPASSPEARPVTPATPPVTFVACTSDTPTREALARAERENAALRRQVQKAQEETAAWQQYAKDVEALTALEAKGRAKP